MIALSMVSLEEGCEVRAQEALVAPLCLACQDLACIVLRSRRLSSSAMQRVVLFPPCCPRPPVRGFALNL